ncbi:MAG TPA: c-type cytochrome, partial [Candidatus Paceibacterota bacterium]|nr:c-type cytochrome [Candidatus Paceibacterota bacterium]
VDARPMGLALAARRGVLVVCNSGTDSVSLVDLETGKVRATWPGFREPFAAAITPDEKLAVVSNLLPGGTANRPDVGATLKVVDLEQAATIAEIQLPAGSSNVRQLAISGDGRWVYVVHTVGRFDLPTTQLDRGWINTDALSIIELPRRTVQATVLLDRVTEGAANPWGVALANDGQTLWVSLSGTHEVARIDLKTLHELLAGTFAGKPLGIWADIKSDPARRGQLVNDFSALYIAGLITRIDLPANGLRGLALSADGTLAVGGYFSGNVLLLDSASLKTSTVISLGPNPAETAERIGERIFHDATICYQKWLSCATCHPDTRADGLNWDLLNDGLGNPKNTRSLVLAGEIGPVMSLGVRTNMAAAVAAGFKHIEFSEIPQEDLNHVIAYLRTLKPEPSPYRLPDGSLSAKARKGKTLFESASTGCAQCHSGPIGTDQTAVDVGTQGELDKPEERAFVTPRLVELWRTAPYLHDGSAATLMDVLTTGNKNDQHGRTAHLNREQLEDLVEYLRSL